MVASGNNFKWPEKVDALWYSETDIAQKIIRPQSVNNRGSFAAPVMK